MPKAIGADNVEDFCEALLDKKVDGFLEYEEQTYEARVAYETAIERALTQVLIPAKLTQVS